MVSDTAMAERLKDEVGGLARKIGVLRGWSDFRRAQGTVPLSAQPYVLEGLRNTWELAVLKLHHLATANSTGDASFSQFVAQFDSGIRDTQQDLIRSMAKALRKKASALTKYRDNFVAHPDLNRPPPQPQNDFLEIADETFCLMQECQRLMHGGMNYEAEVDNWRDSTLKSLNAIRQAFKAGIDN